MHRGTEEEVRKRVAHMMAIEIDQVRSEQLILPGCHEGLTRGLKRVRVDSMGSVSALNEDEDGYI